MNWKDRILFDSSICRGQACVAGTRVMVAVVLDNLAAGVTSEELLRSCPSLVGEDIDACLYFAAELARSARESEKSNWIADITGICKDAPDFEEIIRQGKELPDAEQANDDLKEFNFECAGQIFDFIGCWIV